MQLFSIRESPDEKCVDLYSHVDNARSKIVLRRLPLPLRSVQMNTPFSPSSTYCLLMILFVGSLSRRGMSPLPTPTQPSCARFFSRLPAARFNKRIGIFRFDKVTEYMSTEFDRFLVEAGIS
jgi:hypothetical protein